LFVCCGDVPFRSSSFGEHGANNFTKKKNQVVALSILQAYQDREREQVLETTCIGWHNIYKLFIQN